MESRISIAILAFKKPIEKGTNSRCLFQAEFAPDTNQFFITKTAFVIRRKKVLAHSTRNNVCEGLVDALNKLAVAAENAGLDGFTFDVSGLTLLEVEEDENWTEGLLPKKGSRPSVKLRTKH